MGRGSLPSLRALPRFFFPEHPWEAGVEVGDSIPLPREELNKLHKVLRLGPGEQILVLPGDGRAFRCELRGDVAIALSQETIDTEARYHLTLAQAFPKADKLDEVVRMGTELGVARFLIFPSDRSIVRWDAGKLQDRLRRLRTIAREAAEVCFRTRLPEIMPLGSQAELLKLEPDAIVLSEFEGISGCLRERLPADRATLVIGPEGGWAPREVVLIGDRAVSLGPRVLRVDTAAAAAAVLALLGR